MGQTNTVSNNRVAVDKNAHQAPEWSNLNGISFHNFIIFTSEVSSVTTIFSHERLWTKTFVLNKVYCKQEEGGVNKFY